jgi:hypothetical protein
LNAELLVGALAEDVVHLFVRGTERSVPAASTMHVECEVSGDVSLVAAVARVAAALILSRRCDLAGDAPASVDWIVDSQSLAAVAAPTSSLLATPDFSYREAIAACHRAHIQKSQSDAVGLSEFEQCIWLRVLIVVRNQIEAIRQMSCRLQPHYILVEGDLDFVRHDLAAETAFYLRQRDPGDRVGEPPRQSLDEYCEAHAARLRIGKGPAGAAKKRFDFLLASQGWVVKVDCIEFKSTTGRKCPKPPSMQAYRRFVERYASRDHGRAHVKHVSSLVTPSQFVCACPPFEH